MQSTWPNRWRRCVEGPVERLIKENASMSIRRKIRNRLMLARPLQKVTGIIGKELRPEKWVFIIGCYNSGTTLLDAILRSHPEISGFPVEGVFLTDALPIPESFGWTRMWCQCADKIAIPADDAEAERARRIRRQWSYWVEAPSDCIVEKSVSNAARIPFLERHFPNAYFIYIVRNGFAVAEGIRRRADFRQWKNPYYSEKYPIELCAEQWRVSDEVVSRDLASVRHALIISYEQLAGDPSATLAKITRFLSLKNFPRDVDGKKWHVVGIDSEITDLNHLSLQRLNEMDKEIIESVAKSTLSKYRY